MKKIIFVFAMLFSLFVVLAGCGDMGTPTPSTYKITFDSDGGSEVVAIVAEAGIEIAAPTAPTKDGYNFLGWYLGEVEYEFSVMPQTNITLVAKWEKQDIVVPPSIIEYTITFDANGGDTLQSAVITGPAGSTITLPLASREGYNFLGWYNGEAKFEETAMPEANLTLVAKWEEIVVPVVEYTITLDVNGGNALAETTITAEAGTELTLPTPTREGYNFLGWYNGEAKFEETVMPEANLILVAKWEEIVVPVVEYTITLDVNGGNALAETTITGEAGTELSLPTPTREGYNFLGWLLEGALFNETAMPEANLALVASWEEIKITIAGKKVSILGDSISTFYAEGSEMNSYYSGENQFYYPIYSSTIKTVDLTWWYKLIKNNDLTLGINNSWSGSCAAGTITSAGVQDGRINTLDDNGTPDIVIIYLGTNDCASGFSTETFAGAIETIVDKVKALGVKDIFITTLGYSAYKDMQYSETTRIAYNEEIRKIAAAENCGIVPLDDYIQNDSYSFYLGDNLHYNAKGAALLAKIYEKSIKEYFGIEFTEEIVVERKEILPEGVLGKVTATSNSNFWVGYANNIYLADTAFTNPPFSYRIEITKNDDNEKYYVTKILQSGDGDAYTTTADYVLVISESHENYHALLDDLKGVVVGSIVEFDTTLTFPVEVTFKETDGNAPDKPEPEPEQPPYVPLEGQLHVGAYNTGVWTLYESTVIGYSYDNIIGDNSTFQNFYIIKLTKNTNDDNYTITGLKNVGEANVHTECDYYIFIFSTLEAKSFYENAKIGGTVVMTDDITSGNCSLEFK